MRLWLLVASVVVILALAGFALYDTQRQLRLIRTTYAQLRREQAGRGAAEAQVRQLQKMEAVGQLTGGIAHDFNNMLGVIIGALDMVRHRLQRGADAQSVTPLIDNAFKGAQRAAVLTARLLAFSRKQPLSPSEVDVNKLIHGMSDLLHRALGEAISIEIVAGASLWRACIDAVQLETALLNLLVNARDAMQDCGKLTIETSNADLDDRYASENLDVKPGQYVQVSVTDTGAGMAADVLERVFEPFFTTKGPGRGTGLGLSQVFGFTKQSDGHVKIYSELGRGTTLPRYVGSSRPSEGKRAEPAPLASDKELILLVEDEDHLRQITAQALRELGYEVIDTGSPREALRLLDMQPSIVLLLTDVVMPEMSGRELANMALERRPALKVLYTTGYTRNAIVHNGVVDPGVAFLQKPFTVEQLARKVRQSIDDRVPER